MTIRIMLLPATIATAALAVAGCSVEKKSEGDVTLPKYEVTKVQEGNVTVPEFEVKTPDVSVQEKKVEVDVPKVTTEKRTITVPDIDVKPASEK
jgi:hypothetical protein